MKTILQLIALPLFLYGFTIQAQNPITSLQHQGATTIYYGSNSFVTAYASSVNGDTLVLSSGTFTAPASIAKKLKIFGVGHYPDTVNTSNVYRTEVTGFIYINDGADSLMLEGISFKSGIAINNINPISGIHIKRCALHPDASYGAGIRANNTNGTVNSLLIEGSVVFGIYFYTTHFNSLIIRNNVFTYGFAIAYIDCVTQGLIENNILASDMGYVNNCLFRNNIGTGNSVVYSSSNCEFYNNVWTASDFSTSIPSCIFSGNHFSIQPSSIFLNYNGAAFTYLDNFHLQNPNLYLGTNSTQVGIYGGAHPYKDKAIPSIPHIEHIEVGPYTNTAGNLPVHIKVKPQEN